MKLLGNPKMKTTNSMSFGVDMHSFFQAIYSCYHDIARSRRLAICIAVSFILLVSTNIKCSAQHVSVATEGSSDSTGIFAYLVIEGSSRQLCVAKCSSRNAEFLFSKKVGGVNPPICVSNAIVVVDYDGIVTKYGLDGKEIFSKRLVGNEGVSRISGRWDSGTVFMTSMKYTGDGPDRKPQYECLWVDVRGGEPVLTGKVKISQPWKLIRIDDAIAVCGQKKTELIDMPKMSK